jgi:hypothetical protein
MTHQQFWVQLVGALFIFGWNLVMTPLILGFIRYILRVPLIYSDVQLLIGDDAIHGESGYALHPFRGPTSVQEPIQPEEGERPAPDLFNSGTRCYCPTLKL